MVLKSYSNSLLKEVLLLFKYNGLWNYFFVKKKTSSCCWIELAHRSEHQPTRAWQIKRVQRTNYPRTRHAFKIGNTSFTLKNFVIPAKKLIPRYYIHTRPINRRRQTIYELRHRSIYTHNHTLQYTSTPDHRGIANYRALSLSYACMSCGGRGHAPHFRFRARLSLRAHCQGEG